MEWTIVILFIIAALLFIISMSRTFKASREEQKRIDLVHVSVMKEINDMQEAIRNLNLDIEVVMKEAGVALTSEERSFAREVLDLYKRNYSIASIAEKMQVPASQIEQLVAPFQALKDERRKVAHEN